MFVTALPLIAHPDTPPKAVAGLTCTLSWQDTGHWVVGFIVDAPPSALILPNAATPARVDGLWQRTCFELFLLDAGDGSYREFNFSPSGEWAAYAFDGYRDGMRALGVGGGPLITSSDPDQFSSGMAERLAAIGVDTASIEAMLGVPMPDLPEAPTTYALNAHLEDDCCVADGRWRLGLSAVIEEVDGAKSYWALAHPPGSPDFHHPDCFVVELPAAE